MQDYIDELTNGWSQNQRSVEVVESTILFHMILVQLDSFALAPTAFIKLMYCPLLSNLGKMF